MRGKELLFESKVTLTGHPQKVLTELMKIESDVIEGVELRLRLRGSNWWADEYYTLHIIKEGNSSASEHMVQGLYKQGRLPPDALSSLLQYIDEARQATG